MTRNTMSLLAGASTIALLATQVHAASELQSWGVILQGSSIRVGVNSFGTFGNGNEYGSGINFDKTGTGTFDYSYDFLAPGSPYDAFSLSSGTTLMVDNNNDEGYTDQNVSGTVTDYSGVAHDGETWDNRVVWESSLTNVAITKAQMAERLGTSRSQLDRLLDPTRDGVNLSTLARAARALGRTLRLELV